MAPALAQHYLVRPVARTTKSGQTVQGGVCVPLIAVDQLPDWIAIDGVPRELAPEMLDGMVDVRTPMYAKGVYDVLIDREAFMSPPSPASTLAEVASADTATADARETTASSAASSLAASRLNGSGVGSANGNGSGKKNVGGSAKVEAGTHTVKQMAITVTAPDGGVESPISPASSAAGAHNKDADAWAGLDTGSAKLHGLSSSMHAALGSHRLPLSRDGSVRAQGSPPGPYQNPVSAFCRHWCNTGTCKYGMTCRFNHVMPTTIEGLREVGLTSYPLWWVKAMGFTMQSTGYNAVGMAPAVGMGVGMGIGMGVNPALAMSPAGLGMDAVIPRAQHRRAPGGNGGGHNNNGGKKQAQKGRRQKQHEPMQKLTADAGKDLEGWYVMRPSHRPRPRENEPAREVRETDSGCRPSAPEMGGHGKERETATERQPTAGPGAVVQGKENEKKRAQIPNLMD